MSEPFLAEIRIFAGTFAPRNWAFCDGQIIPISQNTALFSLIGTTYGGDGRSTTALPNLQGRAPMHPGRGPGLTSRQLGQRGGTEVVTLAEGQMPGHNHLFQSDRGRANSTSPLDKTVVRASSFLPYQQEVTNNLVDMADAALPNTGGSQPHNNMQPFLAINFIIALQGLYPDRG